MQADESDAQAALAFIQPDVSNHQHQGINRCHGGCSQCKWSFAMSDFNRNAKARMRMIAQYAIAGERKGAVIGTDHAAENITGFFTKHGDGGADILPLFRLNKRQGKQLLAALGADEKLYLKVPTADLEEDKPGLADEVALVLPITKSTTISKVKPSTLNPKPLSKDGGTKQPINATYQLLFLMIFGNNAPRNQNQTLLTWLMTEKLLWSFSLFNKI